MGWILMVAFVGDGVTFDGWQSERLLITILIVDSVDVFICVVMPVSTVGSLTNFAKGVRLLYRQCDCGSLAVCCLGLILCCYFPKALSSFLHRMIYSYLLAMSSACYHKTDVWCQWCFVLFPSVLSLDWVGWVYTEQDLCCLALLCGCHKGDAPREAFYCNLGTNWAVGAEPRKYGRSCCCPFFGRSMKLALQKAVKLMS